MMKEYIELVAEGKDLTEEQAKAAMEILLSGEASQAQIGNQLYFRGGRSVLSRPVPPGRDRVSDWKVWNVEKIILERASERIISGVGTFWKVK